MRFIPLVNSLGGEMVPLSTWHALKLTHLAYRLTPLLIKPGIDVLLTHPSLANYLGWSGAIVLDRSDLTNSETEVHIISPFDGAKICLGQDKIEALILALQTQPLGERTMSDEPLRAATQGWFWEGQVLKQITDVSYRMNHEVMEKTCQCPTCSLRLTKAYLHHLWSQVPGLCQRYLVQHNVFRCL